MSLCQYQQKSRTLSVQRRVFRRGGTANKRGPWRTPLLRGSSWLGRQCTAEPKAGLSVPTRSQDAAAGSAPLPRLSPFTWSAPPAAAPPRALRARRAARISSVRGLGACSGDTCSYWGSQGPQRRGGVPSGCVHRCPGRWPWAGSLRSRPPSRPQQHLDFFTLLSLRGHRAGRAGAGGGAGEGRGRPANQSRQLAASARPSSHGAGPPRPSIPSPPFPSSTPPLLHPPLFSPGLLPPASPPPLVSFPPPFLPPPSQPTPP